MVRLAAQAAGGEMRLGEMALEQAAPTLPNSAFATLMAEVLGRGAQFRFAAPGSSMTRFIRDRDVITVAPLPVRLGDVAAFVSPLGGRLTVHRVVGIEEGAYRIKGDNCAGADGAIERRYILGRVTRVEREGKRVRLGLGPERVVIALLSRRGWLYPVLVPVRRVVRPFAKSRLQKNSCQR